MVTPGGFLKRLVFGDQREPRIEGAPIAAASGQHRSRQHLLAEICGFLLESDLEITQSNLCAAQRAASGADPALSRRVMRLRENGERITQQWLDDVCSSGAEPGARTAARLAEQLGHGIDTLSRIASQARDTTSEYTDALERHVEQLQLSDDAGDLIVNLAGFARGMLKRSRRAERELRESENEAALLRRDLDRARHDAEIDYLTGLPNRRAFERVLAKHVEDVAAAQSEACVAFCDIDRFKAINDTHGHASGDRVIRVVGEMLSRIS